MSTVLPNGEESSNKASADVLEPVSLLAKFVGVMAIKTAKDVVNYPPMVFDEIMLNWSSKSKTETTSTASTTRTNEAVMLAKFLGVLVFKVIHDATYYPMVWTQRMAQCQSLEECEV